MNKTLKLILIYTILFGVLTIGLFVLFILAHKSFIQYGDGYKQGYFWVVEVRQQLHDLAAGEGLHMWSWSKGLGMNVSMGYIIDPFMIIAALFPPGYIELGYTVANLFKMYCGGLVFLLFCKYVELDEYKCLVGSLCYTFSSPPHTRRQKFSQAVLTATFAVFLRTTLFRAEYPNSITILLE